MLPSHRTRFITTAFLASLLFAGTGPAHADDDKCHMQNYGTLTLEQDHGIGIVHGEVNGMPAAFALDTGAYTTTMVPASADKFHLAKGHMDALTSGISGESRQYYVRLDSLSVGDFKAGRRDLVLAGEIAFKSNYDALIGADLLFARDLEMDFPDNKVRFFRPLHCDATHLAYWDDKAPSIPIQKSAAHNQSEAIVVEVNGQKLRAVLDSGAFRTTMTLDAAARLGITPDSPGVIRKGAMGGVGDTGRPAIWQAGFERIAIGDETIAHPQLLIADLWGARHRDSHGRSNPDAEPDMLLGMDFFQTHRLLFSQLQRRLYYSYTGGKVFGSDAVTLAPQ